jgi:hypothetical protein
VIAGRAQPPAEERPAVTYEQTPSASASETPAASSGDSPGEGEPAATGTGQDADVPPAQATRRRQADRLIRMGSNYLNAGMKRKAAGKFQQVLDDFADLPQADQARRLLLRCR